MTVVPQISTTLTRSVVPPATAARKVPWETNQVVTRNPVHVPARRTSRASAVENVVQVTSTSPWIMNSVALPVSATVTQPSADRPTAIPKPSWRVCS